ncbi:hypothetical protein ACFQ07_34180 [Actinomadura adrarensis]|uniref:Uncharacterized protein n=1 Tax=Actinomadura adrarensis TaxID=1819600 RepID=A0ABW3CU45_9ACTN
MQAHHNGQASYYRCRFPEEYALANKVDHPRNIYVREADLLPDVDKWLTQVLAPHRIAETIRAMQEAQTPTGDDAVVTRAKAVLKDCAAKLDRYRVALEDGGGSSASIVQWIAETEAEKAQAEQQLREAQAKTGQVLTEEEIAELVQRVDDLRKVIPDADPKQKEKLYERFGLKMTYVPAKHEVRAEIRFGPDCVSPVRGVSSVRGQNGPERTSETAPFGESCEIWINF